MPSRVTAVMGTFPAQLRTIIGKYGHDLAARDMSDDLLHDIARLIEDFQRVLDWTATDLDYRFGKGRDRSPYFPLGTDDEVRFLTTVQRDFPSVPQEVIDAMERHQPYHPAKTELGFLHDLTRVNKHQDFTVQMRSEYERPVIPGRGSWTQIGGAGGVPPQRVPVDSPNVQRSGWEMETIFCGWMFVKPPVPVLQTLDKLSRLVTEAVTDIRQCCPSGCAGLSGSRCTST